MKLNLPTLGEVNAARHRKMIAGGEAGPKACAAAVDQPKPRAKLRPRSPTNKKRARDIDYMAWVKTLPCLVCAAKAPSEAAHTGPRGLGQKAPDSQVIPLCTVDHRTGRNALDRIGPEAFQKLYSIDLAFEVADLNRRYGSISRRNLSTH